MRRRRPKRWTATFRFSRCPPVGRTFVAEHPNFHMHYTPTYSSWLNQIEL